MPSQSTVTVVVTRGSGFVGSYLILKLLAPGYTVRITIRSMIKKNEVRKLLEEAAGARELDRLSFYATDFTKSDGWAEAVRGCTYSNTSHHRLRQEPRPLRTSLLPRPGKVPSVSSEPHETPGRGALSLPRPSPQLGTGKTKIYKPKRTGQHPRALRPYHNSKTLADRAVWDFV